jgi:hypothetical protein
LVLKAPDLKDIYFPPEDDGSAMRRLQQARERLNQSGEDPLDDAIKVAEGAKRRRATPATSSDEEYVGTENEEEDRKTMSQDQSIKRPRTRGQLLEKKKSATSLEFEDDDEEIEEVDGGDDDILSSAQKPLKATSPPPKQRKSQQKPYEGRRPWSDVEKNAIIDGIQDPNLGFGRWAEIRQANLVILKDRTSGQIKVRHRRELSDGSKDNFHENSPLPTPLF